MTSATMATYGNSSGYLQRAPNPSGLAEVLDLILDKGLVVDLYVRVSLVGIELLTIDARIVVASVDTYLRFAEAVNRLDLAQTKEAMTLPELIENLQESTAGGKTKGALEGVKEKLFGDDDDDDDDGNGSSRSRSRSRTRSTSSSGSRSKSSSGGRSKSSSSRSRSSK
jgi:gas vesicle structural protein